VTSDHATQPVCQAPCAQAIDTRAVYVIGGDGIPRTSQFMLPSDRDAVTLTVDRGSRAEWFAGLALIGVGGAGALAGFLLAPHPETPSDGNMRASPVPLLLGLGGLAVGALGAVLLFHAPTRVRSSSGRSF
jgi:hypothetical protein